MPQGVLTNFYRRFPGDYARDTAALTLEQHGAYTLLLDLCYGTEKPLPNDRELIYRLIRCGSASEKAAVDFVIDAFFTKTRWGYTHKRVAKEIIHAESRRKHAADAAAGRWHQPSLLDAPSNAPSNAHGNAQTMQFQTPDSRLNPRPPYPPQVGASVQKVLPGPSNNGVAYIDRYGQTIEVTIGRRHRVPNLESTVGLNADDLVSWLAGKGFAARILPPEDPK